MDLERVAGGVLVGGSVLFLVAAFMPISRVFAERDPQRKLELIEHHPRSWRVQQLLFALGAVVTAIGVGLVASRLAGSPAVVLASLAAAGLVVGAAFWVRHTYLRAVHPDRFVHGSIPGRLFARYTLLTQAGLAVLGAALLAGRYPAWLGWLAVGSAVVLFGLYVVFKDMPPFTYYLITLVVGVVMVGF